MKLGNKAGERTRWSWWTRLPLTCLVLGVCTALACAAGSALFLPVRAGDGRSAHAQATRPRDPALGEGAGTILVDRWSRPGAVFYEVWAAPPTSGSTGTPTGDGTPEDLLGGWPRWAEREKLPWGRSASAPWPGPGEIDMRFLEARGWPFPLVWCQYTVDWKSRRGAIASPTGAWAVGADGETVLKGSSKAIKYAPALPHRIIATGLSADIAILGAGWFALLRSIHALRQRAWGKQGLCTRCGHDVLPGPERRCGECRRVYRERAAA